MRLPLQLTTFVGRECQVAEVSRLLGGTRLLTLVGAGGVGKTRLALRVAEDLTETYAQGVWLVELGSLADPRLVPQTLATALGVSCGAAESVTSALARALQASELLLVLDNCEHLVGACAEVVEQLLRTCPKLRVLATSRQPLGIGGETAWRVPSLICPDPCVSFGTDEIASCEAVRLFVDRARAVLPGFALEDRNAAAVAQICRRLDGIPLAIELAAARVKVLGPTQILERLGDRFRLLVCGSSTAPSRQRTLRAMLDWSFELLSESERVLLRRLAVFAGGWTLEAAQTVCGWEPLIHADVPELLFELVDRSVVVAEGQECVALYRLLETVRQYALEHLGAVGDEPIARNRHSAWYLDLAERAEPELTGPDEQAWLERLESEHDNLREAIDWAMSSGDTESGLRIGAAVWKFWLIRGHQAEGQYLLEAALARGGAPEYVRARALTAAGSLAWSRADLARAHELQVESLALWQGLGDQHGVARALHNLGNVAADQGDYDSARVSYEQALSLRRELRDEKQLTYTLGNLATVARYQGNYQQALALEQEGLALARASGDQWGIAHALKNLSRAHLFLGHHSQAKKACEASLALFRELGGTWGTHFCLEVLAALEGAGNQPARAARLLGAADGLRERFGLALGPAERVEYLRIEAAAVGRVGQAWFAAARAEGQAMSLSASVAYALSAPEPAAAPSMRQIQLSKRELEVVELIAQGLSNREIAEVLVVTERTAEAHVTHVLQKLGMRSRAQVAVWAVERGLVRREAV